MASVSILLPDLRGGGAERVKLELAHEFAQAGVDVEFVLMRAEGSFLEEAQSSFSVVNLDTSRFRDVPVALVRYLRRRRPDVLLAAMWPLTVIAPLVTRLSRSAPYCKVLVSEHSILSVQYKDWGLLHRVAMRASMAIGYRLADHRVGVSSGVTQDMAALSALLPSTFHVIHNPIPLRSCPSLTTLQDAEELWSVQTGARILTVGSMKAVKNHPLLLRAFAQLEDPNSRLMIVGEGQGHDSLVSLASSLGVAERVIFAGFQIDPTPFYKTADLFVLSSDCEGFGNVIVEAMACGTPVVSTDCPSGPGEILEGGRYGHLVPVGDVQSLACSIKLSLGTDSNRATLISRASDFSPHIAARNYLDLLNLA